MAARHKLIGTKVWLEAGEEVTELEPEEDGFVRVKKRSGEEGSVSVSALSSTTGSAASPEVKDKRCKIKTRQKLVGTKVMLEPGDTVTLLEEEDDDWVTVLTAGGDQGSVPVACLGKLPLSWPGRTLQVKSSRSRIQHPHLIIGLVKLTDYCHVCRNQTKEIKRQTYSIPSSQ